MILLQAVQYGSDIPICINMERVVYMEPVDERQNFEVECVSLALETEKPLLVKGNYIELVNKLSLVATGKLVITLE